MPAGPPPTGVTTKNVFNSAKHLLGDKNSPWLRSNALEQHFPNHLVWNPFNGIGTSFYIFISAAILSCIFSQCYVYFHVFM